MSENKVNNLLGVSMDKIKEMVDVNTVIGDPITAPNGTTVIPVSRVSYGFAGGGSDLPSKAQPEKGLFAGGSGAGDYHSAYCVFGQSRTAMCAFCRLSRMFRLSIAFVASVPDVVDRSRTFHRIEDKRREYSTVPASIDCIIQPPAAYTCRGRW